MLPPDQAGANRITRNRKHDWDDRCRLLCCDDIWGCCGGDDINFESDQFGCDLRGALAASLRPAVLDRDGAALDPAKLAQPLHKRRDPLALQRRRAYAHEPDRRQLRRLLRARRQRPCRCAA
jgi:hypothetical protein